MDRQNKTGRAAPCQCRRSELSPFTLMLGAGAPGTAAFGLRDGPDADVRAQTLRSPQERRATVELDPAAARSASGR
jgi:hypothetical protein